MVAQLAAEGEQKAACSVASRTAISLQRKPRLGNHFCLLVAVAEIPHRAKVSSLERNGASMNGVRQIIAGIMACVVMSHGRCADAQGRAFACKDAPQLSEAEGKEFLEKVQARYVGIESLKGNFQQHSYVAALDESEDSSGEMWFSKPGKMRWEYSQPRKQSVVVNESTLWLYQPDKGQVMVDDIGNVLLSNLPISFMMGVGNLSRDFELRGGCRGPEGAVLSLVPKKAKGESSDALEGFDLLVDTAQFLPKGAKISSLGGNVTSIVFKNVTVDGATLDPRRFVLEYPKGVDVMDRRLNKPH